MYVCLFLRLVVAFVVLFGRDVASLVRRCCVVVVLRIRCGAARCVVALLSRCFVGVLLG